MRFNMALDNVQIILDHRFISPFWKLKNKLKIGIEKNYNNYINEIDTFINTIIGELKDKQVNSNVLSKVSSETPVKLQKHH